MKKVAMVIKFGDEKVKVGDAVIIGGPAGGITFEGLPQIGDSEKDVTGDKGFHYDIYLSAMVCMDYGSYLIMFQIYNEDTDCKMFAWNDPNMVKKDENGKRIIHKDHSFEFVDEIELEEVVDSDSKQYFKRVLSI